MNQTKPISVIDRPHGWLKLIAIGITILLAVSLLSYATSHAAPAPTRPAPAPTHEWKCGNYLGSCTMYFNLSETRRIAAGDFSGAGVGLLCSKAGLIGLGVCEVVAAWWSQSANSALSHEPQRCLKMKIYPVLFGAATPRPGSYTCPRWVVAIPIPPDPED